MDKIKKEDEGISISGTKINNLRFADDIDLIDEDEERLEDMLNTLNEEGKRYGLTMNFDKTKTMVFGEKEISNKFVVDGF